MIFQIFIFAVPVILKYPAGANGDLALLDFANLPCDPDCGFHEPISPHFWAAWSGFKCQYGYR